MLGRILQGIRRGNVPGSGGAIVSDLGRETARLRQMSKILYMFAEVIYFSNPRRKPAHHPIDLENFRNILGDPSRYFASIDRLTPIVVLHETGEPQFAVVDGGLVPYPEWYRENVPFIGDPSPMPRFQLDLNPYASILGNVDDYFVNDRGVKPLIVRHADGVPAYVVEDDDTLTPWEPPAPNPAAAPVVGALDQQAGGATFSGG